MPEPLLVLDGLTITFPSASGPTQVVRDVSFSMGRERIGIVGESGSGKSLTARALLGLVPSAGRGEARRMELGGTDLLGLSPAGWRTLRGRRISMVMQDPKFSLNPVLTVGRQLCEPVLLHEGVGRAVARQRVLEMLERVGIADAERVFASYPHQLSGGMGQRVMIAMMVICAPDLLIADEPTSALDVLIRDQVLGIMSDLVVSRGMGLLLISHDLGLVSRFCDRVIVMYRGRVVEELRAGELYSARHDYTRGLVACLPSVATRGCPLPTLDRRPEWER